MTRHIFDMGRCAEDSVSFARMWKAALRGEEKVEVFLSRLETQRHDAEFWKTEPAEGRVPLPPWRTP